MPDTLMQRRLPHRLYHARTVRVLSVRQLLVSLEVWGGVHLERRVHIEGVDAVSPPGNMGQNAMRCMVLLLGAKNLLVQVADFPADEVPVARVYLDERVDPEAEGMAVPYGMESPCLEVGNFYRHLGRHKFNVELVKQLFSFRRASA